MLSPELEHAISRFLPFAVIFMMFMIIRLVKVFTNHQQKMAEILNRSAADHSELAGLRREIAELRTLMNDHVLALDGRVSSTPPTPLADRLSAMDG
jgi:hypothetical protein